LEVENDGLKIALLVIATQFSLINGFRGQIELFPNKNGKIIVCTKFAVKKTHRSNDS
jgi:hypothetical protein